jgi:DNA (cytosine-5)-methyltransferase 1
MPTSLEICAGAGGQALGLEQAGFDHVAVVEIDPHACQTLRANRPTWRVIEQDLHSFSAKEFRGKVDLFAGGVPCPPFSVAGKQLGSDDERDLFPTALRLIEECKPTAVMIENVRGIFDPDFKPYRVAIQNRLREMGYESDWTLHNASNYGVPQLRPRAILIGLKKKAFAHFSWPAPDLNLAPTVGQVLRPYMAAAGWRGVDDWAKHASDIAPTLVGGSKKHGGPDLGPSRARRAWAQLGVEGKSLADAPPPRDFEGIPRLTIPMVARIQGFPPEWFIVGRKTAAYRQIGNAFPPPVAAAIGRKIRQALDAYAGVSAACRTA